MAASIASSSSVHASPTSIAETWAAAGTNPDPEGMVPSAEQDLPRSVVDLALRGWAARAHDYESKYYQSVGHAQGQKQEIAYRNAIEDNLITLCKASDEMKFRAMRRAQKLKALHTADEEEIVFLKQRVSELVTENGSLQTQINELKQRHGRRRSRSRSRSRHHRGSRPDRSRSRSRSPQMRREGRRYRARDS